MKFLDNARTLYTFGMYTCLDGAPIKYVINYGEADSYTITSNYHEKFNKEIVEEGKFINGFKVVKLANGKYSYVKEENNKMVDYYFDVALNFNSNNMAMVGKDGSVVWIDSEFKYLDSDGNKMKLNNNCFIYGWQKLYGFNNEELAKVEDNREYYYRAAYVDKVMNLKVFKEYNGMVDENKSLKIFGDGSVFEDNVAILKDKILFSSGYYMNFKDLVRYLRENGSLKNIENMIREIDKPKMLKKAK